MVCGRNFGQVGAGGALQVAVLREDLGETAARQTSSCCQEGQVCGTSAVTGLDPKWPKKSEPPPPQKGEDKGLLIVK